MGNKCARGDNESKNFDLRTSKSNYGDIPSERPLTNEGKQNEIRDILNPAIKISKDYFNLMKVIGRGNSGNVFLVRKRDTNELYAMKVT